MGMFDYVKFEITCPNCGEMVDGFQSKDGPCSMIELNPDRVRNFYTSCDNCKTWISCEYIPPVGGDINVSYINKHGLEIFYRTVKHKIKEVK